MTESWPIIKVVIHKYAFAKETGISKDLLTEIGLLCSMLV